MSAETDSTKPRSRVRRDAQERIWTVQAERLRQAITTKGTTATGLAKALQIGHKTYFRDFLTGKKKSIDAGNLALAAQYLDVDLAWLSALDHQPKIETAEQQRSAQPWSGQRTLPLLGIATGGSDGRLIFSGDVLDELACPPQLERVRDPYAVAISGESMIPRYRAGEIAYVNPSRPPRRGDDVVVQVMQAGELSGYVKELIQMTEDRVVVRQLNPEKRFTYKRADVRAVHVIDLATR
jgi:phage repressor protein C with HTH and peptisase S24 domain